MILDFESIAIPGAMSDITVHGEGPQPCIAMILGEAPGEQELKERRPFVGPSGKWLNEHLFLQFNADRESFFIDNCVKRAPIGDGGRLTTPSHEQIDVFRPFLIHQICNEIKPRIILSLGNSALKALFPKIQLTITQVRGNIYWSKQLGCFVLPTLHPAAVLRDSKKYEADVMYDFSLFVYMFDLFKNKKLDAIELYSVL